jgi:hypothetical protein
MRSIRPIAAAIVAVFVSYCEDSLHAEPIAREPEPGGRPVLWPAQAPPEPSQASFGEAIKSAIGRRADDPNFDPKADLNHDGIVNALDVAMFRLGRSRESAGAISPPDPRNATVSEVTTATVTGERIIVESQTTFALPGTTVSVLFLIRDNTTPLLSYTLDVNIVPQSDATGTVMANVSATNFFDARNLITAGGAMRDPFFSVIQDNGNGGVSVTTITSDLSTVQAVDDVNDVLAQVFFDVPQDALGDFTIELSSGSVLVDGNAASIPYTFTPGTIRVTNSIPAVSEWGVVVLGLLVMTAGSVIFAQWHGAAGSRVGQC